MKVLVIGQGGREHALCWKLSQSPRVTNVYCAPGNAGTGLDVQNVDIGATDIARLVSFARKEKIDLTVVGPEAPLVDGLVDAFLTAKLRIFGPTKAAAQLEGSKVFFKEVMRKGNIPTAEGRTFTSADDAIRFLQEREDSSHVVKADGLAQGKGVIVCSNKVEALDAIKRIMVTREFGAAGDRVVIEDRLQGQEVSVLAVVDGRTIIPLAPAQDHKAAWDNDQGPNTGGMGAYTPAPFATPELMEEVETKILIPTVHTLKRMGIDFRGILYAGIMLTPQGPKVLEFNVRLGDPETQPVLMRLKTDLFTLLSAAADGRLQDLPPLQWDPRPALCVVMAAEGYPGKYDKGHAIRGLDAAAQLPDVKVFHAGTTAKGDQVVTDGGRVLGVTAIGNDLDDAKRKAYEAVKCIRWQGAWCRKDISDKARSPR
ncbi:phosphoribosylamine--glycine ligase [Planctomyces sp. SH-PL14]|uniref:phosphoribosylamine--glycine ligase n=1 Tax=Planctomyces sp. SH-PL14 TaxID=1632864 RepID=UPI00078B47C9|nr:phosphoribosylamine--glycine ligase [Planctomyces sp. SH-PL14]AMV22682.1 Phosphoribosylamine--glycine ligase [Planctomyces sp. SH-PL14]